MPDVVALFVVCDEKHQRTVHSRPVQHVELLIVKEGAIASETPVLSTYSYALPLLLSAASDLGVRVLDGCRVPYEIVAVRIVSSQLTPSVGLGVASDGGGSEVRWSNLEATPSSRVVCEPGLCLCDLIAPTGQQGNVM